MLNTTTVSLARASGSMGGSGFRMKGGLFTGGSLGPDNEPDSMQ